MSKKSILTFQNLPHFQNIFPKSKKTPVTYNNRCPPTINYFEILSNAFLKLSL